MYLMVCLEEANPIKKTFNGDFDALLETSNLPPINK